MKLRKDLKLREEALAGFSAGVVGTAIGFPFDLVKTRMQTGSTNQTSIIKVGRTIVQQEGMLALYKGLWPPLISISILTTITFPQYAFWRQLYGANPGWDYRNGLAGMSCGPIGGIFSTVENLVKTQMQLDNISKKQYSSSFACVKTLVQEHGVSVIYTGHVINTFWQAMFLGNYFFVYEGLREELSKSSFGNLQIAVPLAGGTAGASSWFLSFPMDSVRAGVQGQSLPPKYGVRKVFSTLMKERGILALYSGARVSVYRAFVVSSIRFSIYEGALWFFGGGRNYTMHPRD